MAAVVTVAACAEIRRMTTVAARFGRAEGISAMDNLGHSIKLGLSPLPHHLGITSFGHHTIWYLFAQSYERRTFAARVARISSLSVPSAKPTTSMATEFGMLRRSIS